MINEKDLLNYLKGELYMLSEVDTSEIYEKEHQYELGSNRMCEKIMKWIQGRIIVPYDETKINYEAENARLQNILNMKETEFQEKAAEMINDLIRYEREIELLKAKLSVVELIFGK